MGEKEHRFEMRVSSAFLRGIDAWRRQGDQPPSRAEAIRRLVENSLRLQQTPRDEKLLAKP